MKEIDRKTVFLYPSLNNLSSSQLKSTNSLISSMNLIVDSANDLIMSILKSGCFSFVSYVPSVLLRCVSDDIKTFHEHENVRICIIGFNEIDYRSNYKEVITAYKSESSDISHLVAIHINDSEKNAQFTYDESGDFDVIVRTNISQVDSILTSIMLDISLYHYFMLSSDLKKRKDFNIIKFEYLKSALEQEKQISIYGSTIGNDPMYLPFSLKNVKVLARRKKNDTRIEAINNLIIDFYCFILEKLSHKAKCNMNGSLFYVDSIRQYINNVDIFQSNIATYLKSNPDIQNCYVLEKMTKNGSQQMVEYKCINDNADITEKKKMIADMVSTEHYQIIEVSISKEDY